MSSLPLKAGRTAWTNEATLWTLLAFAMLVIGLLLHENGTILPAGMAEFLHEVTHDARHALGVPCH